MLKSIFRLMSLLLVTVMSMAAVTHCSAQSSGVVKDDNQAVTNVIAIYVEHAIAFNSEAAYGMLSSLQTQHISSADVADKFSKEGSSAERFGKAVLDNPVKRGDNLLAVQVEYSLRVFKGKKAGTQGEITRAIFARLEDGKWKVIDPSLLRNSLSYSEDIARIADEFCWAWGFNFAGTLGDGTTLDRHTPVQVSGLTGIKTVAAGEYYTVAIKKDGTVWAWGRNDYGQLGDGTLIERHTPVQVSGLTDAVAVAAGVSHTVAIKSDGTVWTWGDNLYGKLGDGTYTHKQSPVQVLGLTGVTSIAVGRDHTVAVKKDGTVWAWGLNSDGQLGGGTTTASTAPVQVYGLTEVKVVTAGEYHNVALRGDSSACVWGNDEYGQLGIGHSDTNPLPILVHLR